MMEKKIHLSDKKWRYIFMAIMNVTKNVKNQFSNDKNLAMRINFYKKYTTNKYKFADWLFDKYVFKENMKILELGCGNGSHWDGKVKTLPDGCCLVLSDFSDGMLELVKEKFASNTNVSIKKIDIQEIPFENETFDVVIANHMLFHVPNLGKALSEVKRVLKENGVFYSATDGNGGMRPFLHKAIAQFDPKSTAFTEQLPFNLQNGSEILSKYFENVQRFDYENTLAITDTQDLIEWLKSTKSISGYTDECLANLYNYFEDIRIKNGAINIPRETGVFISKK